MPRNDPSVEPLDTDLPLTADEASRGEEDVAQNPLMVIHRLLRGRYRWAITLGLIGLIAGGIAGYLATEPLYRSVGFIRIRPVLPRVIYATEQSDMMPMFNAFVDSQAALMGSRRVIDFALDHPDWEPYAQGSKDEQVAEFEEKLSVSHPRGSERVNVSFIDENRQKTQAAVSAIVHSYERIYNEYNMQGDGVREDVLERRRTSLANQLDDLEDQIAMVAGQFGAEGLEQMHELKVEELGRLEQKLNSLQVARAVAEGRESQVNASTRQQISSEDLSAEQIAVVDSAMSQLLQEKRKQEAIVEELARTLGSSHRRMQQARATLESLDDAITERAQIFKSMRGTVAPGEVSADAAGLTLEQIRDQERRVRQLYEELEAESLNLAQKLRAIAGLRSEMARVEQRLNDTKNRLDALDVESTVGGRIQFTAESYGYVPSAAAPYKDRRAPLAAAGAAGGAGFGVGLIMLLGFMDRRLKGVDDARRTTGQPPLLGVVPQLPSPSDPESLLITGQSVHHIRTQLQIGAKAHGSQIFTIAGSSPGTGKTSLTLALGLSYAASNHKVLLIDADLGGAALTHRARAITAQLLRDALISNGRLDPDATDMLEEPSFEGIIKNGTLTDREIDDIEQLRVRLDRGLASALRGRSVQECTAEVGPPGLSILTSGRSGDEAHAPQVSPQRFRRILDEARKHYEAILVDTGPIPGPIESSVAASEADGVILLLARGDDRTRTEYTVNFLHSIGAKLLGLVFNRAGEEDVSVFGYSSSASMSRPTASRDAALDRLRRNAGRSPGAVGPLVQAVLCTSRPAAEGEGESR